MIPHNALRLTLTEKLAAARVLDSGMLAQGAEVAAFETELAERFRPGGAAVCVANGTAAIRLAARACDFDGVPSVPTYSCVSLYHATHGGSLELARPLCDSDPDTFNADADIVVHTYGVPFVADDADSCVWIEDFTQAPGAAWRGRSCGSLGTVSVISFGATKPLGIGAGGAVLGDVDAITEMRDIRDIEGKRTLRERFPYTLSDLHASIGRERLRRLDDDNDFRAAVAWLYEQARPKGIGVQTNAHGMTECRDCSRVWYRYVIRLERVSEAQARFKAAGVETIVPLESWELLHRRLDGKACDFPHAETIAQTTLSLPIWPGLAWDDARRVADVLNGLGDLA